MIIERAKNASRNMIFGIILNVFKIVAAFIMRTAMINYMGIEYLGLNGLFTSLLQVLNLAELGVGSALVFSMYKPIIEDDKVTLCALLKLYRLYYRVIGLVVLVLGVAIIPFLPNLIKSGIPSETNLYILYGLNLLTTVMSYWLFAYKNSLFQAFQRVDVTSKISFFLLIAQYSVQLFVVIVIKDYYLYLIVLLLTQVLINITTAIFANKFYPDLKPLGSSGREEKKKINRRIADLFTAKLGGVIVNSVDVIVISAFLGLRILAIYQNYYYIISSLIAVIGSLFAACIAGIGNSLIIETKEKNFRDLKAFTLMVVWMTGFCTCCLLNLYQPFMKLWVGTENMFDFYIIITLCIYFFVYEINCLLNNYKDASGMWHEDRFRPLITAMANLVMNIILVNILGIEGVILSTIISMLLIGMPWLLHNLFSFVFEMKNIIDYIKKLVYYFVVTGTICGASYLLCKNIDYNSIILTMIIRGIICIVLPNIAYLLVCFRSDEFYSLLQIIKRVTKNKIDFTKHCKK